MIGDDKKRYKYSGNFKIEEILHVYIDLDLYKGFLYVEPNNTYGIILPPKKEKTIEQELDPYFNKESFSLHFVNQLDSSDLNLSINKFNP